MCVCVCGGGYLPKSMVFISNHPQLSSYGFVWPIQGSMVLTPLGVESALAYLLSRLKSQSLNTLKISDCPELWDYDHVAPHVDNLLTLLHVSAVWLLKDTYRAISLGCCIQHTVIWTLNGAVLARPGYSAYSCDKMGPAYRYTLLELFLSEHWHP